MREAALQLAGKCAVVQVNIDESPGLASRFSVRGVPAVVLMKEKQVVDTVSGALDTSALMAWCRRHLA